METALEMVTGMRSGISWMFMVHVVDPLVGDSGNNA
jgi:hypothetical protein